SEGVYLLIEAVNRVFFRRRRIPVASLVYADNDSANFSLISPQTGKRKKSLFEGYRLMIGSASSRSKVRRLIGGLHRLRKERRVAFLTRKLNTSNYLRWLAGAVLTNNYDGFEQNYALYEHGATGKYHMIPWDYEGTWGRNCYGKRCPSDLVRIAGYNALTEALLADADIRQRYRALLADLLETKFTEQAIMPIVSKLHGNIADAVHRDHTRSWAYSVFEQEPELIRKFIRERRDIVSRDLNKL
ncbi:MAG: spore coat protein CotH, partial [Paenibacillus sp.]|nr:spore coat protein CotH [Paenibacillus sp.]